MFCPSKCTDSIFTPDPSDCIVISPEPVWLILALLAVNVILLPDLRPEVKTSYMIAKEAKKKTTKKTTK